ncbi:MAG: FAD-dependent oxidoreductase, partial [Phycisphaerae bacterium]|nr:FAD-dependent oxidoreductase [Phycisphaerae bacterium]
MGHDLGSSHGRSRMIRLAYSEHPDYVPLLHRAYQLWEELERLSGRKLLHQTGGLYLGLPGSDLVDGALRSARTHGLAHELLQGAEIARRFPPFCPPSQAVALFEPAAGFLLPEQVIRCHVALARASGA